MPDTPLDLIDVERTLNDILAPLREQQERIDQELAVLKTREGELRQARRKIVRLLGANTDDTKPGPKRAWGDRSGFTPAKGKMVSAERLNEVETWLRAHYAEDEPFYATGVAEHPDWRLGSQSQVSHSFRILTERGILRLDRIAKQGRAKHYALTRKADGSQ